MSDVSQDFFPLGGCLVEGVNGFWMAHIEANHENITKVPLDHNIQLVLEGTYELSIDGHDYTVKKGDIIYYHGMEEVHWKKNKVPVTFYTIIIKAGSLKPLSWENRVFKAKPKMLDAFQSMYSCSIEGLEMRLPLGFYGHLMLLLNEVYKEKYDRGDFHEQEEVWWALEKDLRKKEIYRTSIPELCKMSGYSRATINRSCQKAVGKSPIVRLREIRLQSAKSYLMYTDMRVTQISEFLGYPRMHEFSREFKKFFQKSPSFFRNTSI